VNDNVIVPRGIFDITPFCDNVNALHLSSILSEFITKTELAFPIIKDTKVAINNPAKNINPLKSLLNMDDNVKKLTNMNGAKRYVIYAIDARFKSAMIFYYYILYDIKIYNIIYYNMETKEQLINAVKKWVKIDNEIRVLQKEITNRRKEKIQVSKDLMDVMRTHEIDSFNIKDGELIYNKKNVKKPISQKVLLNILSEYYQGDILKATEINNFISENREYTVKESITRKINKSSSKQILNDESNT
jgi:hypothetical protein